MWKTIAWIVAAVIVIGGGIWWWTAARNTGASSSMASDQMTPVATSSLPQGNSDQAISEEMTDINTQMNGLSSDTANISSSINDQPVLQAE